MSTGTPHHPPATPALHHRFRFRTLLISFGKLGIKDHANSFIVPGPQNVFCVEVDFVQQNFLNNRTQPIPGCRGTTASVVNRRRRTLIEGNESLLNQCGKPEATANFANQFFVFEFFNHLKRIVPFRAPHYNIESGGVSPPGASASFRGCVTRETWNGTGVAVGYFRINPDRVVDQCENEDYNLTESGVIFRFP